MAVKGITGKFFTIQNLTTEHVLDIQDSIAMPGQAVVTWSYTGADNQLWFMDPLTRTVRSKLDDTYCLDLNEDRLVINYYKADEANQKWDLSDQRIRNYHPNVQLCLGVDDDQDASGAFVVAEAESDSDKQKWAFQYRAPVHCLIKSYMHGKVVDIKGENAKPGAEVIMYEKKSSQDVDNQQWYEDQAGVIRSKLNHFAIDASANLGSSCKMQPYKPDNDNQQWVKSGNRIVLKATPKICMDIKGESKSNRANLCAWEYKGSENQHWFFDYI